MTSNAALMAYLLVMNSNDGMDPYFRKQYDALQAEMVHNRMLKRKRKKFLQRNNRKRAIHNLRQQRKCRS